MCNTSARLFSSSSYTHNSSPPAQCFCPDDALTLTARTNSSWTFSVKNTCTPTILYLSFFCVPPPPQLERFLWKQYCGKDPYVATSIEVSLIARSLRTNVLKKKKNYAGFCTGRCSPFTLESTINMLRVSWGNCEREKKDMKHALARGIAARSMREY